MNANTSSTLAARNNTSQATQTGVQVYHSALPADVIATIKTVGMQRYEEIDISISDSLAGREFKIASTEKSIGFFKYYKTTSGAIKGALKFLNGYYPETPDIEVYINPAHINLLPVKWANAEARPVIKFEVGQAYASDQDCYKVVESGSNIFSDGHDIFALLKDAATGSDEHYSRIRHDNGSEVCGFTIWLDAVNGRIVTLRADRPSEPVAEIAEPIETVEPVATVATTKRLEILNNSLAKKQAKLDARIAAQYARQAETNGQPLNDKRNGQSTMNALANGERAIFGQFDEIRKTEAAIKREAGKIEHCKNWMDEMPQIIKDMVASGEIIQWRKHPQYFFVKGVDKGRFSFQDGRVFGRHLSEIPEDQYPLFQAATSKILRALKGDSEPVAEVTTQGEITAEDVNFTDSEWDTTPTPDGSNSGNTPRNHNTLKSAVASHFNAATATKSLQAYYLAFWRGLRKCNSCTLDMCGEMVTITRLANGTFEVNSEIPAPAPIDWHTIIDDIAISDFNLIDSSEWADLISEAEIAFEQMIETERDAMQCDDYDAECTLERKNKPVTPSFELLATKQPAKPKKATRAKFVQRTGTLFDTPKVSTTDLIARRAAQRKALGDRLPPAPLFR